MLRLESERLPHPFGLLPASGTFVGYADLKKGTPELIGIASLPQDLAGREALRDQVGQRLVLYLRAAVLFVSLSDEVACVHSGFVGHADDGFGGAVSCRAQPACQISLARRRRQLSRQIFQGPFSQGHTERLSTKGSRADQTAPHSEMKNNQPPRTFVRDGFPVNPSGGYPESLRRGAHRAGASGR
ncbi:hypothetical protein GCM10009733_049420 [Nonomuraea maheshkhaliensis]|uniref:Uncharacterized protein n=1 Tax=Nonomuraea maheshkhaliensis TaxID=419590 RepID=A0ABP4RE68_9ACTN